MTQPASHPEPASRPSDARRTTVRILYGVTSVPIVLWCAFLLYAIAKANYDRTSLEANTLWFVFSFGLCVPWLLGVLGSAVLSWLGRPWLQWGVAMLIALGLAVVAYFGWHALA